MKVNLAVCCILVYNDYYLAVTRKEDTTKVGFPGGKVDDGESCQAAVIREVYEETGLSLKEDKLIPFYAGYCLHNGVLYWTITYAYVGDDIISDMVAENGTELMWCTSEVLCDPDKSPFHLYNKTIFELDHSIPLQINI